MEPNQEPPQRGGRHSQNIAVNDIINGNDENENMSTKRTNNQSKTLKTCDDTNNSSLNPNAQPFYPLQQVQNLNSNTVNIVNENANQNFNGNITQVYNMNAINNAPMFHQLANQILVLRLPTGLPIHNEAGIQIPQMIIPLQIPVPVSVPQDHDYHLPPPTVILQESSMTTSGSSPMSVSPFEGIEITRHSSPIPFEFPSTEVMEMTQVGCLSTPEVARTSLIKKTEEELNFDISESPNKDSSSQEALKSNLVEEPIPRYKIPSPTKMTTRSRGRKPVEREKRPIEEPGSLPSQLIPENQNKPSSKRIIKAKKSKATTVKVKSEEISLVENKSIISNKETASEVEPALELGSEIEIAVINETMDYGAEHQIDTELNEGLPLTGKKNPKNKSKATKIAKSKLTENKNQSKIVEIKKELPDSCEIANNFSNKTIKTEPIKRELNEVERGSIKIENDALTIKKEETVQIKSEPLSEDVTLLELPNLDNEDDELPIINTKARNSTTFIPTTSACAEELEFQKEVEHYSKPEVQCQIFFPKLVMKRSQVRGDNCVVEYAVSGRSHCRICKTTIKKEELRFSIPVREREFGYNTVIDTWHHARCFWGTYKVRSTYNMNGFQYLSQSDQNLIRECILQLK